MVFKRNTLRNTRKFKQSTSINSSNVKITQSKPVSYKKPTVKTIIQPTSVSQGRQNYNTGYTSDWRLKDLFKTNPPAYAEEIPDISEVTGTPELTSTPIEKRFGMDKYDGHNAGFEKIETVNNNSEYDWQLGALHSKDGILGFSFGPPTIHTPNEAAGELDNQGSVPPPEVIDDELQPRTFTTPEPLPKVDYGDATPGGNASFSVKDYVGNEERTQDIWLHPNVSSEQHQAALDRQAEAKLANQIQRDYVASLRGGSFDQSGNLVKGKTMMPTQQGFDSFLDKIDTYNIPISEKAEITKHYNEKKDRLGSFDSSGMWEMGRTKSKNPNKAERLKIKAASGEKLSKKEKNYLAVVSGKNYVDDYGVALGMGQGLNFTATDYTKMFEPGITKADIAKYNPDKPKPNWLGYEDI